jgi:3',5'-cyclic AMP phosphodiesterase CpdA
MRIAHLSDLHFGRRVSREKLLSLERDIATESPDLLAITGDITDHGRTSQFRSAIDFLSSLGIPFISVPGNREICFSAVWEWMFPPLAMMRYKEFFGNPDRILYRPDQSNVVCFGLNSVHPFPSWPGSISRESRYWLKEKAAQFPECLKILLLHHPVLPVVRSSSFWAHTFSDAGELLNICTQTGISLILQGHKHRSSIMEVIFPERNAKIVVSACGAPLMSQWDPVYHIIDISLASIVIRPKEFREGRFNEKGAYRFSSVYDDLFSSASERLT